MPTAVDLLHIIATTPDLLGAACRNHRDIFDACSSKAAGPHAYAKAIRVCAACPALEQCYAWVSSLPPRDRPVGVCAGIIRSGR
jgi:hypothetical protein